MAIGFKLDDEQWRQWQDNNERLHQSIADLSENLAKWQAQQTAAIEEGFSDLVTVLGGADDEDQNRVEQFAIRVRNARLRLQTSIDRQPKGE